MKHKSFETALYSTIGVAVMLLIVVAINVITSMTRMRVDLTEDRIYTLSEGTRKILSKLDGKLKIRFYCTRDEAAMPVNYRNHAQRIDDLLAEYKKLAGGKLEIQKLDPQPDTDAEDFANADGVEPRQVGITESVFMGLSFTYLDTKAALPFMDPGREKFLEYDISRAIAQVVNPERPVIGLMSGLPVFGMPSNPMMMQMGQRGQEPWLFVSELQKDFNVKQVQMETDKIDDDIKLLIVMHPKNISDKAQFAIDQFVLRGGRLIAFLDPYAAMEGRQNPMMGGGPQGGSNMEKLLKAWGLEFDSNKVLADANLRSPRFHPRYQYLLPNLTPQYIKQDEIITGQIDNLILAFAGVFTGTPAEGLKMDTLLESSEQSQLVDRFMAEMAGEQVGKDFKPGNRKYSLAVRLTGKFKTAFPEGKPEDKPAEGEKKEENKEAKKDEALKAGPETTVILVGDADMLHEQFYAEVQSFLNQKIMMIHSGNLTFLQNAVELLGGDASLVNARTRATKSRNFEVIRNIRTQAAADYQAELQKLEEKKNETQRKLSELQSKKDPKQRFALSPEQAAEIERYKKEQVETNKRLKEVRKQLRRREEKLETTLKLVNILVMPGVVTAMGIGLALYNRKRTAAK